MTGKIVTIALALGSFPLFAQLDLSGFWQQEWHMDWQEAVDGPDIADFLGLPLNASGKAKALSFSPSAMSEPERQCIFYTPEYVLGAAVGFRMWSDSDPNTGTITAWKITGTIDRSPMTIWMDGRPHPPAYARHTTDGFTTGEWQGDILRTYTTHMKQGYIRRNGVPSSDQATLTMHIVRHGDILTITGAVDDPANLTEPYVVSKNFQLNPHGQPFINLAPCVPETEIERPANAEASIPHFLPGKNPFADEFAKTYHLPAEATLGGAETMYPEFRKKLKATYQPPETCTRYCCGGSFGAEGIPKGCPSSMPPR
jgi:hypothetical protein